MKLFAYFEDNFELASFIERLAYRLLLYCDKDTSPFACLADHVDQFSRSELESILIYLIKLI